MRAVLTYHSIDPSGSPISVSPEEFRTHVRWLGSGQVRVVPLRELQLVPARTDAVALTFDDAFVNFAEVAWPLLKDAGLPVTLFAVAGHSGGTNDWGGKADSRVPTLPLCTWTQLGRLAEEGVTLGGHTHSHPHLTRLPDGELEAEVAGALETMRRETGRRADEFAYPYGDVDTRVATVVAQHYRLACTTELRPLGPLEDPVQLPRLDMFYLRASGRLEAWGTSRFAGGLWLKAQARRLRESLTFAGGGW